MSLHEDIYTTLTTLGEAGDEQLMRLLCRSAEEQLRLQLRSGVTWENCRDAFVMAAAFLAMGMYQQAAADGDVAAFAAGDFSVTMQTGNGSRWHDMARQLMAPYTGDGFAFVGVRG